METKICKVCGRELNISEFRKHKAFKDGLDSKCKECQSAISKEWYQKNKEKVLAERKAYYYEHKEERLEYAKHQYKNNREKIVERNKRSFEKNKDKYDERIKRYRKLYAPKLKSYKTKYNKENREKVNEQLRISCHKYRAKVRQLPNTLTSEQWEYIKNQFNNSCAYCGKRKKLTIEHFVPASNSGGLTHNNVLPVCQSCNSSKRDRPFATWYKSYKYYSKEREQKILKFLNYTKDGQVQQLKLG